MQQVEKRALVTCRQTTPCAHNTFIAVHKEDTFHDHLKEQNADISLLKKPNKMENFLS